MFRFFDLNSKVEVKLESPNVEFFMNKNREVLAYNTYSATCQKLNPNKFIGVNNLELNKDNLVYKFHSYATNKFMKVYTVQEGLHIMETYYFEEDTLVYQLLDSPSDFLKYIV